MKTSWILVVLISQLISFASAEVLAPKQLSIEGAKISSETDAKRIASRSYLLKMGGNILATEGVRNLSVITAGFSIEGFAAKGDKLWEARVVTLQSELRAILWVHSKTGEVYFVIGPWMTDKEKDGDGKQDN